MALNPAGVVSYLEAGPPLMFDSWGSSCSVPVLNLSEPTSSTSLFFTLAGCRYCCSLSLRCCQGAIVAAAAGGYSQQLPLPSRRAVPAYLPLLTAVLTTVVFSSRCGPHPGRCAPCHGVAGGWRVADITGGFLAHTSGPGGALPGLAVLLALPVFITSIVFIVSS
jgi:hypothetical protein